ncbi:MAG: alpha/beta fold hydrolase [Steroidobacteraceae bacterium]
MRRLLALGALAALAVLAAGCAGHSAHDALSGRLLSVSDLPAGWSAAPTSPNSVRSSDNTPCLSGLARHPKGVTQATERFTEGKSIPSLVEVLASGPHTQRAWAGLERALARCQTITIDLAGTKVKSSGHPIAFPRLGDGSSAYAWAFSLEGIKINFDLIVFEAGRDHGYVSYADLGAPAPATVKAFASAAVRKLATGSTARVPNTVSIASMPVQIAHTNLGDVAYRALGSGPPLVLVMGYGATMEDWDPRLIDTLAQHYRVVIFDNAGVGQTQVRPAPITIDAMANQTSALIATLGLKRPNVLGWSMGSMITQALAVLHPGQVNRLILCAAYPGNGTASPPSRQTLNEFESGQDTIAFLFPADQTAAQHTYLTAISSYPTTAPTGADVVKAQGHAIDDWWAGQDRAGTRTATITAPTLITDGTLDRLDPPANSHTLANLIPKAQLTLYPDAGHAFLFGDPTTFERRIKSFLG